MNDFLRNLHPALLAQERIAVRLLKVTVTRLPIFQRRGGQKQMRITPLACAANHERSAMLQQH